MCGAIFLDQEFLVLMRDFINNLEPELPDVWDSIPHEEVRAMTDQFWEHGIKHQFDGSEPENKEWRVQMPPTCAQMTGKVGINIPTCVPCLGGPNTERKTSG